VQAIEGEGFSAMKRSWLWAAPPLVMLTAIGCIPGVEHNNQPTPVDPPSRGGPPPAFESPINSDPAPPPISGGTLLALPDGRTAVASDPDRDSIFVVDYQYGAVQVHEVKLQPGDQPWRAAVDAAGRVHVALRGGGAIVTLAAGTWDVAGRRAVCAAPRGLAYDGAADQLYVACAEGDLVSLPAAPDGAVTSHLALPPDLRDVVVSGGNVFVSRFRSAEVLVVQGGAVSMTLKPPSSRSNGVFPTTAGPNAGLAMMEPSVAWRMVPDPQGGVMMLHQRATSGAVVTTQGGYGGFGCGGGIVESTMTPMQPSVVPQMASTLGNLTLAVDVAMSPDGNTIAVAAPGNARQQGSGVPQIAVFDRTTFMANQNGGCTLGSQVLTIGGQPSTVDAGTSTDSGTAGDGGAPAPPTRPVPSVPGTQVTVPLTMGELVAVAFDVNGQLLTQTREPAHLRVFGPGSVEIVLSDESRLDTGHGIFHANSGSSIACASCHPEGGDDGRVWTFQSADGTQTRRRTQNLRGGIMATAPFHWDGKLPDMTSLMTEVFVGRMSGPKLDQSYVTVLGKWLDTNPAMPPFPVTDSAAVARGQALFAGNGCATCHAGAILTDNRTQDVGTGMAVQTPSLRGVAWRPPYMHDGCAPTLRDRFSAPCGGGDRHAVTSKLDDGQIADLVAYLQTL
jgi:mono/diheme cytochrome c family protein